MVVPQRSFSTWREAQVQKERHLQRALGINPQEFLFRRIRSRLATWRKIGTNPVVLSWLSRGVKVRWRNGTPPPPFHQPEIPLSPKDRTAWRELKERYLRTGAIRPARDRRFVSAAFLRPKSDGGMRLCIDLRHLNQHCAPSPCTYETLNSLRELLDPGDWMVSFDVQDAFHHIGIADEDRPFFTFKIAGEYWECQVIPFGWTASPMIFTKVMRAVIRYLRSPRDTVPSFPATWTKSAMYRYWEHNITPLLLPYLDDVLGALRDQDRLRIWTRLVRDVMAELGVTLKESKCEWTPTQCKRHLGLLIDTSRGLFLVPEDKMTSIKEKARACRIHIITKGRIPAKRIASFCGLAQSVSLAIRPARFYTRDLYSCLRAKKTWSSHVRVSHHGMTALRWWERLDSRWNGKALWRPPTSATLSTDSSDYAWGATLKVDDESEPKLLLARGFWPTRSRANHINVKELAAIRMAITTWAAKLIGRRINLITDSLVVAAVVTKLTTSSEALMTELRQLNYLLECRDLVLQPKWICSAANKIPDWLSRLRQREDWRLHPRIFRQLDLMWGPHTVDRFATLENRQLERFNSEFWEPNTEGVDCFAQGLRSWTSETNWANPPWSVLPRLTRYLAANPAIRCTVLAPYWPSANWFPRLRTLATDYVVFPPSPDTFLPGRLGGTTPMGAPRWSIAAFRVAPRTSPEQLHLPSRD